MKAYVTGATGFLGGRLVHQLLDRADEVVALVRTPAKAAGLAQRGVHLVEGDLSAYDVMASSMQGCDAVFHLAADYRVGISGSDCAKMREANVAGTERTLDAAVAAGVSRIVYVSTIGYFGNTHGQIMREGDSRPDGEEFLTCYDETKYHAHQLAEDRIAKGAPILIAQPGGIYGPGDHSPLGTFIEQTRKGRMKVLAFADSGFNFAHVDDIAQGLLLIHDKGNVGETYILGAELATSKELITKVAELSGHKPPRMTVPTGLIKLIAPLGPLFGRFTGSPNLREVVKGGAGVTYWATEEKARRELGYKPRDLETGLRDLLAALEGS